MSPHIHISKSLGQIPPDAAYAILLRHAERPDFDANSYGNDVPITDRGARESRLIGSNPHFRGAAIYSSPILRCIQTAREIARGAGCENIDVRTSRTLGDPGAFIDDPSVAGQQFLKRDTRDIIKDYIAHGQLDGFFTIRDGSARLLSDILADISKSPRSLYVSHDAILVPFISYFTDSRFDDDWLDFLDGAIVVMDHSDLGLIWDGEWYSISKERYY